MLEKFGVHIMPFLGSGQHGTITKIDTGINSTEDSFYSGTFELPQSMAHVLVLAQNCNDPVQEQTTTTTSVAGSQFCITF